MGSALCKIFKRKPVEVMYYGLDAAGKSTILWKLRLQEITEFPTYGFFMEEVKYNGVKMLTWDIGTRDKSRAFYKSLIKSMDGVIFVIDSSDPERLEEAVEEFFHVLVPRVEEKNIPVVVLANKQDVEGAMRVEVIRQALDKQGKVLSDMEIFPTTALTLEGVHTAMEWLASKLAIKIAKQSYLPSMPSASLGKMMRYPISFLKDSSKKMSELNNDKDTNTG